MGKQKKRKLSLPEVGSFSPGPGVSVPEVELAQSVLELGYQGVRYERAVTKDQRIILWMRELHSHVAGWGATEQKTDLAGRSPATVPGCSPVQ